MSRRVLLVSPNSVTRALFLSLLDPAEHEVQFADSLAGALALVGQDGPDVVILQAEVVRASPDALDRLRGACSGPVGFVLADRGYSDERRGLVDARAFGASSFVCVPPDRSALVEAVTAAAGGRPVRQSSATGIPAFRDPEEPVEVDLEQLARWAERLHAKLESLDAYQILRVQPTATDREIQAAFRQRALECHPDLRHAIPDEETRERLYQIFKRVSWALRKVGDPASRKEYDADSGGRG
ncbi:MAG: DnaJ domain-containing protein [Deltaproteobacteria bacterium]|nr:DnaJ domain-containing protein [Deltaproteobacteria bacterium]